MRNYTVARVGVAILLTCITLSEGLAVRAETPGGSQSDLIGPSTKKSKLTILAEDCSNLPKALMSAAVKEGLCSSTNVQQEPQAPQSTEGEGAETDATPSVGYCGVIYNLISPGTVPGQALNTMFIDSAVGPIYAVYVYQNNIINRTNGANYYIFGPTANSVYNGASYEDYQYTGSGTGYVEIFNNYTFVYAGPYICFGYGASDAKNIP